MSVAFSDPIPDSITGNGTYPGWIFGYVPTAAEWNDWYSRKFDAIPDTVTTAAFDTRPYTQSPDANMIWLAQGHRIAFNQSGNNYLQLATHGTPRLFYEVNNLEVFSITDTGIVTLGGDPTVALHAVTKRYVDTNFALKSGGDLSGPVNIDGALQLSGNLDVTGTTGLHGNVAAYQQLALAAAVAPAYVLYGDANHLFHQYQANAYWQLTRSNNQLDWIVDSVARVSISTQVVLNTDVAVKNILSLAAGVTPEFSLYGDATTLSHQYAAHYLWSYNRTSHDLTWFVNDTPVLRVDGTTGMLRVPAGDRGIAPISHTYLTLNGSSTSFADGANFVLASTGNRAPYAFEWYWGATRIGSMDTGGALNINGTLHIKSGVIGLAPSDETYLAINGSPTNFASGANMLVSAVGSGRTNAFEFYWGNTLILNFTTAGGVTTGGAVSVTGNIGITGNGFKPGGGTWSDVSDERLKTDIRDYIAGLEQICKLRPVAYQFNGAGGTKADGKVHYGLIAQDVKPFMPEMVGTRRGRLMPSDEAETDIYTLDATPLIYALVTAVQELSERVTQLELQEP